MMLQVHYFASVRETLGLERETVEVPGSVKTVADLIGHLVSLHDQRWQQTLQDEAVLVALDQTMAGKNSALDGASEVAFFPPVTGG